MKLMTDTIATELYEADRRVIKSNGNHDINDRIIVKYFNPCGSSTWYIVSGTPVDAGGTPTTIDKADDWHLYGRCDLYGDGGELGYVLLSDLESCPLPFGLTIERDLHFEGNLSELDLRACM